MSSISFSSWAGAAEATLKYFNLENETILCPSNTFQATPMVSKLNNIDVKFVDCNKNDLCVSYENLVEKIKESLYKEEEGF